MKKQPDRFVLDENHLNLITKLRLSAYSDVPEMDMKRPFGNGDILDDIFKIIGMKPCVDEYYSKEQEAIADRYYKDMVIVYQIVMSTRTFSAGTYERVDHYRVEWRLVDADTRDPIG